MAQISLLESMMALLNSGLDFMYRTGSFDLNVADLMFT